MDETHDEDFWKADETEIAQEVYINLPVFASSQKKNACLMTPEDREWISIVKNISATGAKLPCRVILKGNFFKSTWHPAQEVHIWLCTTIDKGWQSRTLHLHAVPAVNAQYVRISGIAKKSRNLSLQDPHSSTQVSVGFVSSSPSSAPFQRRTPPTVSER
ncbi:hypothetical protein K3495_g13736 [Podosphaera aphanis]|nr:hypothetical protein K3495_g13736 [Podosphaera aphanis]